LAAFVLIACGVATAEDAPNSYKDAETIWQKHRDTIEYQAYAAEFAQLNNAFRIDERDGCYSLAPGPVNLMLLVSPGDAKGVATVERAFYDTDNAKARCFERSYTGLPTRAPPFLPFVLQLRME
jgi:hypothetical protein